MSEDEWHCRFRGRRGPNGNCETRESDGYPAQGVGAWSTEKHDWLRRFIDATWAAREMYVPVGARKAGAAYIDLFAGPGRIRVANDPDAHDGSPLISLAHAKAPFSRVVLCDTEQENCEALHWRTRANADRTTIINGDCNDEIGQIAACVPRAGLNLAFIDPFGPKALRWSTLAILGEFQRMDLLVNFPTGFIKRNFHTPSFRDQLTAILGNDSWRSTVRSAEDVPKLIELLRGQLATIGYIADPSRSFPSVNSTNATMFHLLFFSKNALGAKIWKSLATNLPSGQKEFGFD